MYADRLPFDGRWAAVSLVVLILVGVAGQFVAVGALPLAYLLMWLAVRLPLHSFGRRFDISYGLYIYAFPVQQMLARADVQRAGVAVFVLASVVLAIPPAFLSWVLVERPAKDWSAGWIRRRHAGLPLQSTAEAAPAAARV
jgi:peptidoglycan/LPS O-acetylase OafA/YrhL